MWFNEQFSQRRHTWAVIDDRGNVANRRIRPDHHNVGSSGNFYHRIEHIDRIDNVVHHDDYDIHHNEHVTDDNHHHNNDYDDHSGSVCDPSDCRCCASCL